jgi:hypothetical protein
MAGGSNGRKDELIARIRDGRARLDHKLASLEQQVQQRVALVADVKDRALRYGRWTAVVVGVVTVTLAAGFLLRALFRPRRRRR